MNKKYIVPAIAIVMLAAGLWVFNSRSGYTEPPTTVGENGRPETTVLLEDNGIGIAQFGDLEDRVVTEVTNLYGAPVKSEPVEDIRNCSKLVGYTWGNLKLNFEETTHKFVSYSFASNASSVTPILQTRQGITLGNSLDALEKQYPNHTEPFQSYGGGYEMKFIGLKTSPDAKQMVTAGIVDDKVSLLTADNYDYCHNL